MWPARRKYIPLHLMASTKRVGSGHVLTASQSTISSPGINSWGESEGRGASPGSEPFPEDLISPFLYLAEGNFPASVRKALDERTSLAVV